MSSEDRDVWDELLPAGFLHGLREAHLEATLAVFGSLSRGAGFKDRSYGYTSYDVLESQIDRVFDGDPAVTRDNLNNSPGWRRGRYRVLLKRHEFGAVRGIRWDRDSATKQLVARQGFDGDPQLALPFPADPGPRDDSGTVTLVLAHSASEEPLELELFLGRPRLNAGGGDPWHWLLELSGDALGPDPRRRPAEPTLPLWTDAGDGAGGGGRTATDADVPMRLRGRRAARPLDEKAQ
ncbi:hypothetical protein [Actinomadura rugatobispora]|uniref:Uncharacterized protein n=1 Tax=Actinomadura rugatobispora TaxID=1994 RepID=A0ABW1AFK6_9ACTN|nr:hypothetical protein GCM10010200_068010 [Actinomadura rugatobispora]